MTAFHPGKRSALVVPAGFDRQGASRMTRGDVGHLQVLCLGNGDGSTMPGPIMDTAQVKHCKPWHVDSGLLRVYARLQKCLCQVGAALRVFGEPVIQSPEPVIHRPEEHPRSCPVALQTCFTDDHVEPVHDLFVT